MIRQFDSATLCGDTSEVVGRLQCYGSTYSLPRRGLIYQPSGKASRVPRSLPPPWVGWARADRQLLARTRRGPCQQIGAGIAIAAAPAHRDPASMPTRPHRTHDAPTRLCFGNVRETMPSAPAIATDAHRANAFDRSHSPSARCALGRMASRTWWADARFLAVPCVTRWSRPHPVTAVPRGPLWPTLRFCFNACPRLRAPRLRPPVPGPGPRGPGGRSPPCPRCPPTRGTGDSGTSRCR
jgi:hypothetical protein